MNQGSFIHSESSRQGHLVKLGTLSHKSMLITRLCLNPAGFDFFIPIWSLLNFKYYLHEPRPICGLILLRFSRIWTSLSTRIPLFWLGICLVTFAPFVRTTNCVTTAIFGSRGVWLSNFVAGKWAYRVAWSSWVQLLDGVQTWVSARIYFLSWTPNYAWDARGMQSLLVIISKLK